VADDLTTAIEFLRRDVEQGVDLLPVFRGDLAKSSVVAATVQPDVEPVPVPVAAPVSAPVLEAVAVAAPVAEPVLAAALPVPPVAAPDNPLVETAVAVAADLAALREVMGNCTRCKLSGGRQNIVFGVGNPQADLFFVGEAPGEQEDEEGVPFVGKAGQLLTDIIEKGIGISRSDVYIANVVKCRPPQDRDPEGDEIVACDPFLARQIELVNPKVIVTLGAFATKALLRRSESITSLRGKWDVYKNYPVMPTFHPAYLLRTGSKKRDVWKDIQEVMLKAGIVRAGGSS
jgi:uracil-DNA glycosylase family 4